MKLDPTRFDEWFRALNGHGSFPWQRRLFREWLCPEDAAESRWPRLIGLPTASGKTALIDLAVLALAVGASCARRRTVFVVDRRVVVDEATNRAGAISLRLQRACDDPVDPLHEVARSLLAMGGEQPLVVATLRGGLAGDDGWARSPAQPAVVLSTVDQAGSRLLFRAYGGHGPRSWPIHAGLLGRDSLFIVDEAHCANPFCETLLSIAGRWQNFSEETVGSSLEIVRMSATLNEEPDFGLTESDRSDPILSRRTRSSKPAELVLVDSTGPEHRRDLVQVVVERCAGFLRSMETGVLGVVVNRVADAREIFQTLPIPDERKILLTGRARGWERDRLLEEWYPRLRPGRDETSAPPLAVVATQCIEVGANLDFDALISEIAPIDALRQRFGRLDRLGGRRQVRACVIAASAQVSVGKDGDVSEPDPVYGDALARTWWWLLSVGQGEPKQVDFGIDPLGAILPGGEELLDLRFNGPAAFPLLPGHLDLLSQTSPPPEPSPELSAFLHGTVRAGADVNVVWRCDLPEDDPESWRDRVAVQPPAIGEACPVPIWEFRRWIADEWDPSRTDGGDVEGAGQDDAPRRGKRPVVRWRGLSESQVVPADRVVPGDTIVVPSSYGGCDRFGWNPGSPETVSDIGDTVAFSAGRRAVLRRAAVSTFLRSLPSPETALDAWARVDSSLREDDDALPLREALRRFSGCPGIPEWLRGLAEKLAEHRGVGVVDAGGDYALVGRVGTGEDLSTSADGSSLGTAITLEDHSKGVRDLTEKFARAVQLPEPIVADLRLAAALHDLGKADPRFQVWLHGGDEIAANLAERQLAKSGRNPRDRLSARRARERAGYPAGARHEVQSAALIDALEEFQRRAHDWDLVRHLVVSHHGFGRPFVPVAKDDRLVAISVESDGIMISGTSDSGLHRLDSGVPERYWRLVRRYGWWGLAWLESILRLADHRRSEFEQTIEVVHAG